MTIPPNTNLTEPSSLFSLSSLESLAVGTDLLVKSGPSEQEGSGVLDVQALAQATQRRMVPADSIAPTVPALLTPNLPRGYDGSEGWSRGTKLVVAGMGLSILALGGAVAFLALRTPVLPSAAPLTAGVVAVEAPALARPAPAAVDAPAVDAPAPSEPVLAPAPRARAEPSDKSGERARMRAIDDVSNSPSAVAASASASAPAAAGSNASIDSLLDKALGAPARPRAQAAAPSGAATPSRDDVLGEMKKVGARIKSCGGEAGTMAIAKITVAGKTGRVTSVDIEGQADARVRACITHEVSRAKLAPFSAPSFNVTYPFRL
jgi:hypothetical protein